MRAPATTTPATFKTEAKITTPFSELKETDKELADTGSVYQHSGGEEDSAEEESEGEMEDLKETLTDAGTDAGADAAGARRSSRETRAPKRLRPNAPLSAADSASIGEIARAIGNSDGAVLARALEEAIDGGKETVTDKDVASARKRKAGK